MSISTFRKAREVFFDTEEKENENLLKIAKEAEKEVTEKAIESAKKIKSRNKGE